MSSTPIPTFEELREMFRETREQIRETRESIVEMRLAQEQAAAESAAKFEREKAESAEKFEREVAERKAADAESAARFEAQFDRLNKILGRLGNRIGDLVETLVASGIVQAFRDLGYEFTRFGPSVSYDDRALGICGEIDLFLENGEYACLVEVKTKLTVDDVRDHMDRLEKYRIYRNAWGERRVFIGAVIEENVVQYALRQGFYVVQLVGDKVKVTSPPGKVREW
jgi:hypothetical protein